MKDKQERARATLGGLREALAPFAGVATVVVLFLLLRPDAPFTTAAFKLVLLQTTMVGIAAAGMTWVIIAGGIDLSVGSGIALASVAAARALEAGTSWPGAVLAAVTTGALCGAYNALLIVALRLPPFIATLGTMGFYRGVAKWLGRSGTVRPDDDGGLTALMRPNLDLEWLPSPLRLAPGVFILVATAVVLAFLLRHSVFGRHVTALGASPTVARLSGIAVRRTQAAVYVLAGATAGLAGLLLFSRLSLGDSTGALGWELDVIAAVVIGGASLSGGSGSVLGALAGAFLMAFLRNRCTAFGWPNYVQEIIAGHVIILAVALDHLRRR